MMIKAQMKILTKRVVALDTIEMKLQNDYISKNALPGQFLHIRVGNYTLRRPVSIADCNRENGLVTILFKVNGQGTNELASYEVGNTLDALGPLGNSYPINSDTSTTVLLIGGGIGIPPLYYLGKTLREKGVNILSVLGFQGKEHVFLEQEFLKIGKSIIVTNDGTYGEKGFVTDILDRIGLYDCYYSCGPVPMLRAVSAKLKDKQGYLSLEERMGCGVGACFACVLPTKEGNGYKKICKDGPVFKAGEVVL
jgi:dihydroorotate dehydrogenase electron transfer subunit